MQKVYRNELLKGVISKKRACQLLGVEREVETIIKKQDYKYNGAPLVGVYEVKSSAGCWYLTKVKINSQEEVNKLVNVCNRYMETMNLIGFFTKEK